MALFTVTTAADVVNASDGVLSLREAVSQANATGAADDIAFAGSLQGRTLTLTQGQLALTADASIDGDRDGDRDGDGTGVTVSGGGASRVLLVGGTGTDARLEAVTVTGGREDAAAGGGVHLAAANTLFLHRSTVSDNSAETGGGLYAGAGSRLTVRASTVSGNSTTYDASAPPDITGGGLRATGGAAVTIEGSSFTGNRAVSYGGGISIEDRSALALSRSQVSGNSSGTFYAGEGGGGGLNVDQAAAGITDSAIVSNFGGGSAGGVRAEGSQVALIGSTVASNTVNTRSGGGVGGGILAFGTGNLSLENSTVTDNVAGIGYTGRVGGIGAARLHVANSIVSGNTEGGFDADYNGIRVASDVAGTIVASNGHNIFGSDVAGNVAGDLEGIGPDRLFATLSDDQVGGVAAANGGPTVTVALRDGLDNPALSGAEPVVAGDADQRGVDRPQPETSNPDIGSFELAQSRVPVAPGAGNNVVTGSPEADTLTGLGGADLLRGLGGDDSLIGGDGGDTLRGGPGADRLDGDAGQDTASYRDATGAVTASLAAGASSGALGRDALSGIENLEGGAGGDRLTGDALANALGGREGADQLSGLGGDDRLFGGSGDDLLEGGRGNDRLDGGAGVDQASWFNDGGLSGLDLDLATGVGTRAGERDLLAGVEDADGTDNADVLRGDARANALGGAGGADQLFGRSGNDALLGALGDDRLNGALGRDALTGGVGADVFDYDRLADSAVGASRDVVFDFAHLTDRIDLATIDARPATAANDAFVFRAGEGAAFTGAGQVRWSQEGGATLVEASVDADAAPELQVELAGLRTLSAVDFVL